MEQSRFTQPRRHSIAFPVATIALLIALLSPRLAVAQGYGYKKEEDPLVLGVKQAISAARKNQHDQVAATVKTLEWQVRELRDDVRVDMKPVIDAALATKDVRRIGYALTELVFHATRQKFHWNQAEKLADHARARARLQAARFYYDEILSHAVRRADAMLKKKRHEAILVHFEQLRSATGSPGLFGAGKRPPDLPKYSKASADVESLLREVYPEFRKSQEKKKPTSRTKRGDEHRPKQAQS